MKNSATLITALLRPTGIFCFFWLMIVSMAASQGSDWPQWRGPDRTGHVPPGVAVPDKLDAQAHVMWRLKVGEGLSSPVVAGGKLFYSDAVEGKETLHTIDASTSQEIWHAPVDNVFKDSQGPAGPRCTPIVDGDEVFALSCKGELRCFKVADGKLVWRVNFTNELGAVFIGERGSAFGASRHGNNGSPLILGGRIYACVGGTNDAGIVCFGTQDGRMIWKSQSDHAAYAAPIHATIAGLDQLVCFTAEAVIGLDLTNGHLLWRAPVKTDLARNVTTPVVFDDIVVVGSHQAGLVGIRVSKTGADWKAERIWTSKESAMNFSSPVVVDKCLYGLGPSRNLVCIDIATGKQLWSKDGYFATSADKSYAAFMVMGKNILALTDGGELILFAADPSEFRELGRTQVCGMTWCNPAYSSGNLFVRDGIKNTGNLLCVRLLPASQ